MPATSPAVVVVTDSTSALPPRLAAEAGVEVVPLRLHVGDGPAPIVPAAVGARLGRAPAVRTSRPSPSAFVDLYEELAGRGAGAVLSVHCSARLSGTWEAAQLAARAVDVPVTVVDSGSAGLATGFAVLEAARAGREPGPGHVQLAPPALADLLGARARARARAATTVFTVASLEALRRGGRLGAATALTGPALGARPVLALSGGHVEPVERARTQGRAHARVADLASHAARVGAPPVDVAVQFVDDGERAAAAAGALADRLREDLPGVDPLVVPLPGVLAAHLGPGTLGVTVAPAAGD